MPWKALVSTNQQLADILGVSRQAVAQAEPRGLPVRGADGRWHAIQAPAHYPACVRPTLQRKRPTFAAWLDRQVPLVPSVWGEFLRRVQAVGADPRWENARPRARGQRADAVE